MYDLNEEEFHESLPKRIGATIYFEVMSIEELSAKVNALVGRRYENEKGNAGYFISDIRQVMALPVTEFYTMPDPGSTNPPIPHLAYHAIVVPIWERFSEETGLPTVSEATTPESEDGKIVAD